MSKEMLISLLENSIKKTIDTLDYKHTNESKCLKVLKDQMQSIQKTYKDCNGMKEAMIKKIRDSSFKIDKKLMTSKTEANLTDRSKAGRLRDNMSQGSILNQSAVVKKNRQVNTDGRVNPSASFMESIPKKEKILKTSKTEKVIRRFKTEDTDKDIGKKGKMSNKVSINGGDKKKAQGKGSKAIKKRSINYTKLLEKHWGVISKFLSIKDQYTIGSYCKSFAKMCLNTLLLNTRNELTVFESKHKDITDKYYEADISRSITPFSFSKVALKAFDLLNDPTYSDFFNQASASLPQTPSNDILTIYRLFFQLINKDKEKEVLNSKGNTELWSKTIDYFTSITKADTGSKLGSSIQRLCSSSFDLSEDNVHRLYQLCLPIIPILTPVTFTEKSPTTSLFMFIIKDPLEYIGILPDKLTQPSIMHKYTLFSINRDKEVISHIDLLKSNLHLV